MDFLSKKQKRILEKLIKRDNITWLAFVNTIFHYHNKFNNHTKLKIIIITFLSIIATIFWNVCNNTDFEHKLMLLKNGFLIAPLIALMVTNQEKIIIIFLDIFDVPNKQNQKTHSLDKDKVLDTVVIEIKKLIDKMKLDSDSFNKKEKKIWDILQKTMNVSVEARKNFNRLNNQTLLFAGILLFIGYIFLLLFNAYSIAFFCLITSFALIINRLFLGIRSIIKLYLIYDVLKEINEKIENLERKKGREELSNDLMKFYNY